MDLVDELIHNAVFRSFEILESHATLAERNSVEEKFQDDLAMLRAYAADAGVTAAEADLTAREVRASIWKGHASRGATLAELTAQELRASIWKGHASRQKLRAEAAEKRLRELEAILAQTEK